MENNTDESKMVIEVSVRNLVEFIMRSGDIDNRQTSGATMDAMAKGTKIHKKIQKMGGNNYFPEVTLKMDFDFQDYKIKLEGRADERNLLRFTGLRRCAMHICISYRIILIR